MNAANGESSHGRNNIMDTLESMRMFVRVVEAGSFTAAGQQERASTAQASRAVSNLEEYLQVRLLHRTTRHLTLTESGHRYLTRIKSILSEIDLAEAEAKNALGRPSGTLRVHALPGLGHSHLTSAIIQYQTDNPEVRVQLVVSQTIPNLVEEGYEISLLAASDLPDSGYVTQVFGTSYVVLVASPDYLARKGWPKIPSDLLEHECLKLDLPGAYGEEWRLNGPEGETLIARPPSPFSANVAEALQVAIRAGAGTGALPVYTAIDDVRQGRFVRVLPQYHLQKLNVYAVYPSRQYVDAKVRTFLEHLRTTLTPALIEEGKDFDRLTNPA